MFRGWPTVSYTFLKLALSIAAPSHTVIFDAPVYRNIDGAFLFDFCCGQECEPAVGRLLVFSVEGEGAERKVNLVAEVETRGAVYVLNGFSGKLLAGINSKVIWLCLTYFLNAALHFVGHISLRHILFVFALTNMAKGRDRRRLSIKPTACHRCDVSRRLQVYGFQRVHTTAFRAGATFPMD